MDENDALTQALVQIFSWAHEQHFTYPLHMATTAADGRRIEYVYPAMGEKETCVMGAECSGDLPLPFTVEVREWDAASGKPKQRAMRAQIAQIEGDRLRLEVCPVSTAELIAELEEEAGRHSFAQIAVAFGSTTVWVRSDDSDRQRLLDDAVRNGGKPMGLFTADREGEKVSVMKRLYPEHAHREEESREYREYLTRLMVEIANSFS
jgi:hypothetical protein